MTWLSKVSALPLGKNYKHLDGAFINQFSFSFFLLKSLKMLYLTPGTTAMYFKAKQQYYSKECDWYGLQFVDEDHIDQLYCKSQHIMGLIFFSSVCFFFPSIKQRYKAENITLWLERILVCIKLVRYKYYFIYVYQIRKAIFMGQNTTPHNFVLISLKSSYEGAGTPFLTKL